jgi:Uma2 family endonuclease
MTTSLRWTSADLLNLAGDGKLREIIDGELFVSTQPHLYHQVLCPNFSTEFNNWDTAREFGITAVAPGLIFADDEDVAPDVIWISRARLAAVHSGGKLRAAPEIVIEVLSPGSTNVARDRDTKLKLYSRRGAEEYWIADWPRHRGEIYRRDGAALVLAAALGPGNTLTSPQLPGFAVPIDRLFLGIPFGTDGDE